MKTDLRPMNLGEILDRTIQIYRAKFLVFVGIAAIPALAMLGLQLAGSSWLQTSSIMHSPRQTAILWNFALWLGYFHISGFLGTLISPALVYVTSTTSQYKECSMLQALRYVAMRWRSYLWITILKLFAKLVIPEILAFMLFAGVVLSSIYTGVLNSNGHLSMFASLLLLAILFIPVCGLFFWLGISFSLAVPAVALEGTAGFIALRRSWVLSKGSRLRIFFTYLTLVVLSWILMYCFAFIVRWIFIYFGQAHLSKPTLQRLYLLYAPLVYFLYSSIYALLSPIYPIALTLFYYDQRIRKEGYDIERMMEAAGLNAPVTKLAKVGEGKT